MERYKSTKVYKYMDIRVLSLLVFSLVLISPSLATSFYISGVNNSASFNYTYSLQGWVNGSQICTPANGLCNSTSSPGGSGYNTADGTWIYNGTSGLTANQTTLNSTYQKKITANCTSDDFVKGVNADGSPICDTPTDTNTIYDDTALQNRVTSVNNSLSSLGNASAVNASLQTEISNRQTNDTNLQNQINSLNSTKLTATDQRYNDTALIGAVNTSDNIKSLGFNLTTDLKAYFDTLYYAASNPSSFISMATALAGLGNWSADKADYINTTQFDNSSIIRSSSGLINSTQFDNATIIRSLDGYFNNIENFTTYLTDTKICVYNATAGKIECISDSGDISGVSTYDYYLLGGAESGSVNLTINETALNNTIISVGEAQGYMAGCSDSDKCGYFSSCEEITSGCLGSYLTAAQIDNATIIRSLEGYYNNPDNLSVACGNITGASSNLCTLVDTDTDTNDTAAVSLITSRVDNITANCSEGNYVIGYDENDAPICDAPAGSGDITGVSTYDSYLLGGEESGDVNLTFNETTLNTTILAKLDNDSIIRATNTSWITENQLTYNNLSMTDVLSGVGNYSEDEAGLYSNISALQSSSNAYYANISSLQDSNTTTNSRIDSLNGSLISEIADRGTNDSALGGRIDSVNSTAVGKASPGTCDEGEVVMNTTTSGVQCVAISFTDTNDTARVDSLNASLIAEIADRQTNDTLYNDSMKSYVDIQDDAQDTCSEISGCVVGAITDGNTGWDNSYNLINSTQLDNTTIVRSTAGFINTTQFDNTTIIRSLSGYYNAMANISTYLTNGKYCFYNSTALKLECTGTMTVDTDSNCSVTNSCPNIVYAGNTSFIASTASSANGNWTLDKPSYLTIANGITNYVNRSLWTTIDNYPTGCSAGQYVSTIGDTLTCGTPVDTNTNCSGADSCSGLIYDHNTSWVKANQYTYNNLSLADVVAGVGNATLQYANSSLGAFLYTNASRYYGSNTSLITTLNMTIYMASTNWTMTNLTLSEASHTLKSYWNGTMWIEVVT